MPTILALDISKKCTGFAFGVPGDVPITGVVSFGNEHQSDDLTWAKAMIWISQQLAVLKPDIVAIEAAWAGNGGHSASTHEVLSGLQSVIRAVVRSLTGREARRINVQSARLTFTGKGRYPDKTAKDVVQRRCVELGWLTYETMQADRADALCVWAHVAAQESPDFALELKFKSPRRAAKAAPVPAIEPLEF